jgi:nucleoside phosphorylase
MKDPIPRIAYFAPTQAEFKDPFRELRVTGRPVEDGPLVLAAGFFFGVETVLVRTGIGPENAAIAAERLFDTHTITEAIMAGYGGGTSPDLDTADMVACSELIDLSGDRRAPPKIVSAASLLERARQTGMVSATAPALTVAQVVFSPEEKRDLGLEYGAAVVEMEGFPC